MTEGEDAKTEADLSTRDKKRGQKERTPWAGTDGGQAAEVGVEPLRREPAGERE